MSKEIKKCVQEWKKKNGNTKLSSDEKFIYILTRLDMIQNKYVSKFVFTSAMGVVLFIIAFIAGKVFRVGGL